MQLMRILHVRWQLFRFYLLIYISSRHWRHYDITAIFCLMHYPFLSTEDRLLSHTHSTEQRAINTSINQWHIQLKTCMCAKGTHACFACTCSKLIRLSMSTSPYKIIIQLLQFKTGQMEIVKALFIILYRSFRRRVFQVNHLHWYWQPNQNNQERKQ